MIRAIDSHTEGEPTRVVLPNLQGGVPDLTLHGTVRSVAEQARVFRERFDWFRSAIVNEPRGHDVLVGALLVPPTQDSSGVGNAADCGVIFFNNVGLLNACGHGTIGVAATLAHLGLVDAPAGNGAEPLRVETPVGVVQVRYGADGLVEIDNVPSYRHAADVAVSFEWDGQPRTFHGDVAWGGNWFFLVREHGEKVVPSNIERLTSLALAIRAGLARAGVTGDGGGEIDHVELFGPATRDDCDSKNFVLCPGKAYDRSPCGTGTSAKLACLAADGKLAPGERWGQESIIGSRFEGRYRVEDGRLIPTIAGRAFITAELGIVIEERDPLGHGIRWG